jgi:hypothetical protein
VLAVSRPAAVVQRIVDVTARNVAVFLAGQPQNLVPAGD